MGWVAAVAAAFGFATELLRFIRTRQGCDKKDAVGTMKNMRAALKNGDGNAVENLFRDAINGGPKPGGLSDK